MSVQKNNSARVLVVGGLVQDVRLQIDERLIRRGAFTLPEGQKIIAHQVYRDFGGGGVNVATALASLGLRPTLVSSAGSDIAGKEAMRTLRSRGVNAVLHVDKTLPTGLSVILSGNKDNVIIGDRGANKRIDWSLLRGLVRSHKTVVVTHLSGQLALVKKIAGGISKGTRLVWNPGSSEIHQGLLRAAPILKRGPAVIINEDELGQWTGMGSRSDRQRARAAQAILDRGALVVVVTAGRRGAFGYLSSHEPKVCHVPSLATTVVDRVGAGDAFVAGFASQWCTDDDVVRALIAGSLNAAANLRVRGASRGVLSEQQLNRLLLRYPLADSQSTTVS